MAQDWFIVRDGKESGPFNGQQLKEMAGTGKLQPDDKVRRSDMHVATKASAIKGLFTASLPSSAESPSSTGATAPPTHQKAAGSSKKIAVIASAVAGACLLLCCGGLGVVAILAPKKPDSTKKEVAVGGVPSDKDGKGQADQQGKPSGPPQVVKFFKGGNREPLELRVLATDEIEIVETQAPRTVTGFSLYFDIRWKKPVDKDNPSWPWRYTLFNKKGEKVGDGDVGTRDKSSKPYDADIKSGQRVMSWIALNRGNFDDTTRIDIHR